MMKKLLVILFFILSSCAAFSFENVVSSLFIDDESEQEIEIVMDKDKMYLPCKYFLDFLSIPYKENHAEKSLTFENVDIKPTILTIGGTKQNVKVFYVKSGITGLKNEYFLSSEVLSKLTKKEISADSKQLLCFISTREACSSEKKLDNSNPFLVRVAPPKIKAYEEITLPAQKGVISLDKVAFKNNTLSDSYSQFYKDSESKSLMFNNSMQTTLSGTLFSGQYKLDMGTNSYSGNLFSFSGLSPQYKNTYKDMDYLLGKPDGWALAGNVVNIDLLGGQLKNVVPQEKVYKDVQGYVSPQNTVVVYINDDYKQELSTYGGYYSLEKINYGKVVKQLKICEKFPNGKETEVLNKQYDLEESKSKLPKHDFILGISGVQNKLWAKNGYIFKNNTKKIVAGYKNYKKISKKTTLENVFIADKIIAESPYNSWNQYVLGNRKSLNFSTINNPNSLEGGTYLGALSYKNNDKMNSKLFFGTSASLSSESFVSDGIGAYLKGENIYNINEYSQLKSSLFASSPNFYFAGSSGASGFHSDRIGGSLSGYSRYNNLVFSGGFSKYESNLGNYYQGGIIDFNDYNFLLKANFKKFPSVSAKFNEKIGSNSVGQIKSGSYELLAEKRIKSLCLSGGARKNYYSNVFNDAYSSSYTSDFSEIFNDVSFPLAKRLGYLRLGNSVVDSKSNNTQMNYNSFNIGYSSPNIKGYNFNCSTNLRYLGLNKGADFCLGICKKLKSGSVVSLNYRYSQTPHYIIDNMYLPTSIRHSINLDFSELYGIGSGRASVIGTNNSSKGYLQATAFLDINKNGKRDKGEPRLENIPIKVENISEVLVTDKKGTTKLVPEDSGIYNVKVFEDELPTLLTCHQNTRPARHVKVENEMRTDIEFGLISSAGSINGSVKVKDEFNNILKIDDLIVSVVDSDGNEVNYANLNEDGTFSVSGLSPGKYKVSVEKDLLDLYQITPEPDSENYWVEIPVQYKDYVNLDNVNLNYVFKL